MRKAHCTKSCCFQYGTCKEGLITIHPRSLPQDLSILMEDEEGIFYCHEGQLLTIFDEVCEKCGEYLDRIFETPDKVTFQCPSCKQEIEMLKE